MQPQQKLEDAEKYMTAALSEAVKGFGMDDPHTAAAHQNLAEQYRVMGKYDLALPLYNEVTCACISMFPKRLRALLLVCLATFRAYSK